VVARGCCSYLLSPAHQQLNRVSLLAAAGPGAANGPVQARRLVLGQPKGFAPRSRVSRLPRRRERLGLDVELANAINLPPQVDDLLMPSLFPNGELEPAELLLDLVPFPSRRASRVVLCDGACSLVNGA
jgi:hypothetical protein